MCFSIYYYCVITGLLNININTRKETTTFNIIPRYSYNFYTRVPNVQLTSFNSLSFNKHTLRTHTLHMHTLNSNTLHIHTLHTDTLHTTARTTAQICFLYYYPLFNYNNNINHRNTFNLLDMSSTVLVNLESFPINISLFNKHHNIVKPRGHPWLIILILIRINMYFTSYTIRLKYIDPNHEKNGAS